VFVFISRCLTALRLREQGRLPLLRFKAKEGLRIFAEIDPGHWLASNTGGKFGGERISSVKWDHVPMSISSRPEERLIISYTVRRHRQSFGFSLVVA
jgi:hypothetical protein